MKKLVIKNIDHYNYTLQDDREDNYIINIEFYNLNTTITIDDILYMDESLLKENMLSIGLLNDPYGKDIKTSENKDIIVLQTKGKRFYLKRIYG